jgi:hypothetical protein
MAASNVVLCGIHRMPRFGDHGRLGALAFRPGQRGSFAVWDSLLISSCRPFPGPTPASSRSAANSHDMLRRPTVVRAGIGEARVREAGKGGDRLFWWHGVFPSPRRGGCRRSRRVGFMPARTSPPPRFARHLPFAGEERGRAKSGSPHRPHPRACPEDSTNHRVSLGTLACIVWRVGLFLKTTARSGSPSASPLRGGRRHQAKRR